MRIAQSVFAAMLIVVAGSRVVGANEKASLTTMDASDFGPGGRIEIKNSFGDLRVVGWDQPRVEVMVVREVNSAEGSVAKTDAEARLRKTVVAVQLASPGHMIIATDSPQKAKSGLDLTYEIRVPRKTDLVVNHDTGDVRIEDIEGDVSATCKTGEITVDLPANISFSIDAAAENGDVESIASGAPGLSEHKLYARVGVGDIVVRPPNAGSSRDDADEFRPLVIDII